MPLEHCLHSLLRYLPLVTQIRWSAFFLAACVALLPFSRSSATSVIGPPFDSMVKRSELIITGRMKDQWSLWHRANGRRIILTNIRFEVIEVHKGVPGREITLQFLGGTVDDTTMEVAAIPKFRPGERVVLFVEKNGVNASPIVGFFHGKFKIEAGARGEDVVYKYDGSPLTSIADVGAVPRKAQISAPMGYKEFTARIREVNKP